MTSSRKLLKQFYFNLKVYPPNQALWKSQLPEVELDIVVRNKIYMANKESYLHKGPRLWLYMLLYKNGHLTSKQIFNFYNIDKLAMEQEFFSSFVIRC